MVIAIMRFNNKHIHFKCIEILVQQKKTEKSRFLSHFRMLATPKMKQVQLAANDLILTHSKNICTQTIIITIIILKGGIDEIGCEAFLPYFIAGEAFIDFSNLLNSSITEMQIIKPYNQLNEFDFFKSSCIFWVFKLTLAKRYICAYNVHVLQLMQRTCNVISEPNQINNSNNDIANKNLYVEPCTKILLLTIFELTFRNNYTVITKRQGHDMYALRIPKCISLLEHFEWNEKLGASRFNASFKHVVWMQRVYYKFVCICIYVQQYMNLSVCGSLRVPVELFSI